MNKDCEELIRRWQAGNISGLYCENKKEAYNKIMETIPLSASVGISGSQTLEELGITAGLESRGNKVFNQYKPGLSREESLEIRNKGASADYYLSSANAIAQTGELVFFSANGHRIAGIANARNAIIVCGVNKITGDLSEAMKRAREYATSLNCKRLKFNTPCFRDGACQKDICLFPEYRRMCCQVLVIEAEIKPDRLKVILVGETLGF